MDKNSKIYIAGHCGLVGSAIQRQLEQRGFSNLITKTHNELDLTNQNQVQSFFADEKPDYVNGASMHHFSGLGFGLVWGWKRQWIGMLIA